MVTARALGIVAILALLPGSSPTSARADEPDPSRAVASALGKGSYPWYDAPKDQAKPVEPPRMPEASQASTGDWSWLRVFGNVLSLAAFGLALAALIGLMIWFWRTYEPIPSGDVAASNARSGASRVESLPEGMRREFESSDPWEEALRRRARGDLAGAVICLFAHQLLTLSRLGLVRLAPGRTGRQLLRSVSDAEFRALAQPTLRLFEVAYYGHRAPTPEEFAALWERAEEFERRVAGGVAA